jgi:hypothetical protein
VYCKFVGEGFQKSFSVEFDSSNRRLDVYAYMYVYAYVCMTLLSLISVTSAYMCGLVVSMHVRIDACTSVTNAYTCKTILKHLSEKMHLWL